MAPSTTRNNAGGQGLHSFAEGFGILPRTAEKQIDGTFPIVIFLGSGTPNEE